MTQKIDFQVKRCTSINRTSYTPLVGELLLETDTNNLYVGDGSTAGGVLVTSGSSGESNTASNVGTAGVGVFKQKTGIDLEFKKINAGSNKVTITDDTGSNEIDVDVNESNFTELINKSEFDAKGDILVATADDTFINLPIGTDGYALKANSSETSGVGWEKVSGNRYKVTYVTTASYTVDLNNDEAIVAAYPGTTTITFPTSAGFTDDGYGYEYMIYNATGQEVSVELSNGEMFTNGLDVVKLNKLGDILRMGGAYPTAADGWFALQKFNADTLIEYDTTWEASNFNTETAVPFNDTVLEDNSLITEHSTTNVARLVFNTGGKQCLAFSFSIDSTGGGSYSVSYRLRLNGTSTIVGSQGSVGNYQTEDSQVGVAGIIIDVNSGDYVELMLDNNNLTGNANNIVLSCKSEV
jgi:hypothetical protein